MPDVLLPGITSRRVATPRLTQRVLHPDGVQPSGTGGEVVLFVHGNISSALFWQQTLLTLGESGRLRPLAVDLRGYGETDALPIDGWHQSVLDATSAEVQLTLGRWKEAADAAERGWESTRTTSVLWAARFAMIAVASTVETTLDGHARRDPTDLLDTTRQLQQRIDAARTFAELGGVQLQRDPVRAVTLGPERTDRADQLAAVASGLTC